MDRKAYPPRPGVREVTDGIFLYTTRIPPSTSALAGPIFVYEVESARADRKGVSFGIDFSGSTNFHVLPAVAATATSSSTAEAAAGRVAAEERARARSPDPATDGSEQSTRGAAAATVMDQGKLKIARRNELMSAAAETQNATAAAGDSGCGILNEMSARVSTQAFCRAVVARVAVQDPNVRGSIQMSCSWELLEPPPLPSLLTEEETKAFAAKRDAHNARIRQQLLKAQSLRLSGDCDDNGPVRGISKDAVKRCRMHGAMYVDQDFPPTDSSLGPSLAATGLFTWRRSALLPRIGAAAAAAAAFGGYGRPLPSDVRPCPFATDASLSCALAALAERPLLVSAALCDRVEEVVAAPSARSGRRGGGGGASGGGSERKGSASENQRPRQRDQGRDLEARRREASAAAASAAAAQSGLFSAWLCVGGIWKEYLMDDFIPCLSAMGGDGSGPCLSRAHGPALWVSMLEKAYARAVGSYSAALRGCSISSGEDRRAAEEGGPVAAGVVARPAEVLGVFTGAPVLQVKLGGRRKAAAEEGAAMAVALAEEGDGDEQEQAAEELWGIIGSWLQQGGLVCLSTPPTEKCTTISHGGGGSGSGASWKNGLRSGFAYTVLQTALVSNGGGGDGDGDRLIRLRGPLPSREGWEGEWADDSSRWTPEAIASLSQGESAPWIAPEEPRGSLGCGRRGGNVDGAGQTFWVTVAEAVTAFVEAGVCFASPPGTWGSRRDRCRKSGGHAGWAQVARRRVVLTQRRSGKARKGDCRDSGARGERNTMAGRRKEEQGEEGGGDKGDEGGEGCSLWMPSRVYALSVYKTSRMFFSLHQQCRAIKAGEFSPRDAGVTVLRLKEGHGLEAVASTGNPVQASACTGAVLCPGRYVIVPTHTGCLSGSNLRTSFPEGTTRKHKIEPISWAAWERPFVEEEDEEKENERAGKSAFDRQDVQAGLASMFEALDADCDGVLSREELDAYLRTTEGLPLQDDVYTWLVRTFSSCPRPPTADGEAALDSTGNDGGSESLFLERGSWKRSMGRHWPAAAVPHNGGGDGGRGGGGGGGVHASAGVDLCLTMRGFVDMYRCIWQAAGRDLEVVARDLRFSGCVDDSTRQGKRLLAAKERLSVVVSVHSDTAGFDLVAQPPGPDLLEAALILPVQRWGSRSSVRSRSRAEATRRGPELNERSGTVNGDGGGGGLQNGTGTGDSEGGDDAAGAGKYETVDREGVMGVFRAGTPTDPNSSTEPPAPDHEYDDDENDKSNQNRRSGRSGPNFSAHIDGGSSGMVALHVMPGRRGAENAVTFVAKSLVPPGGAPLRGCLNCSGSVNASPLPGSLGLSRTVTLLPQQSKIIQHLVPTDPRKPWSWKYDPVTVKDML